MSILKTIPGELRKKNDKVVFVTVDQRGRLCEENDLGEMLNKALEEALGFYKVNRCEGVNLITALETDVINYSDGHVLMIQVVLPSSQDMVYQENIENSVENLLNS